MCKFFERFIEGLSLWHFPQFIKESLTISMGDLSSISKSLNFFSEQWLFLLPVPKSLLVSNIVTALELAKDSVNLFSGIIKTLMEFEMG